VVRIDAHRRVLALEESPWSAGSLTGSSVVTGIATNGTDIWLVDRKQAKVFK
jgi:hypothetical protein